jgi:hypothetical protein
VTCGFLRAVDRQRSPRGPWSQIRSHSFRRLPDHAGGVLRDGRRGA